MKFTIFLCSAFIVSVACVTEPDEQEKYSEVGGRCDHSINKARNEFYNSYLEYDSSDIDTKNAYFALLIVVSRQLGEVGTVARRATSMELPKQLVETTRGTKIVCSKELAEQVREIIKKGYAAANALNPETQTTTPQSTDE